MAADFSLLDLIPHLTPITVVDVGAASLGPGTEPYAGLVEAGKARVIGFEPDEAECDRLNERFGAGHAFYPYVVGTGAPATFFETNWAPTSSLYEPNTPLLDRFQTLNEATTLKARHAVETHRLDDVPGTDAVDFLKLDVQGSEVNVFKGGGAALASAMVVQTEVIFVEMYRNQPLFADVDAHLRQAGFQFHTFLGFGTRCFKPLIVNDDPSAGLRQFLWSDAVYVKDFMELGRFSEEKLSKCAVVLHDVFRSYDLCLYVLREVDGRTHRGLSDAYLQRLSAAA